MWTEIEILIKIVAEQANRSGREVYLVGGVIRDIMLGRETNDVDFVVNRNTSAFAKLICSHIRGRTVKLDELNGIYRVIAGNYNLDFSRMQGKTIEKDLSRRDFTINAIAVKLETSNKWALSRPKAGLFIDPFGGQKDIKGKIIRSIAEKNFIDDPLRLLRTYRFSAQLDFKIEKNTLKQIKKHLHLISKPARERVRDELTKIFSSSRAAEIVEEMDSSGLLETLLPEVMKMKKSARKYYYHPKGLFQHSIETLFSANDILARPEKYFPGVDDKFRKYIEGREWLLKFVSLMHDLAKPSTVKRVSGKVRFFGHEKSGGKIISEIMQRLRFSVKDRRYAKLLIENHMRPGNLSQSHNPARGGIGKQSRAAGQTGAPPTPKARYRFFRDIGDESVDLLVLALADRLSYMRITKNPGEIRKFRNFTEKMVKSYFIHREKISKPRLVDGFQLMKYLGIGPGRVVGELLKIIEQAYHLGRVKTAGEALELAKKKLPAVTKRFGRQ